MIRIALIAVGIYLLINKKSTPGATKPKDYSSPTPKNPTPSTDTVRPDKVDQLIPEQQYPSDPLAKIIPKAEIVKGRYEHFSVPCDEDGTMWPMVLDTQTKQFYLDQHSDSRTTLKNGPNGSDTFFVAASGKEYAIYYHQVGTLTQIHIVEG